MLFSGWNHDPTCGVVAGMALEGDYEPSPSDWVREQVEWFHNFSACPEVDLQDGPEPHTYAAYPPYADYQEKTDREIPVFVLERTSAVPES